MANTTNAGAVTDERIVERYWQREETAIRETDRNTADSCTASLTAFCTMYRIAWNAATTPTCTYGTPFPPKKTDGLRSLHRELGKIKQGLRAHLERNGVML